MELLLWFPQSLVTAAVVLQNLTLRWKRMEILWGERADGVFTFKSNYSNLFRGREKQSSSWGRSLFSAAQAGRRDVCDYESQKGREPGHWLTLIPALPWPHSQQAPAFPGWELELRWVWHLWHFSHQWQPFTFGMQKRILLFTVKNYRGWQWSPFWIDRDGKCDFSCGFYPPLLSAAVFLQAQSIHQSSHFKKQQQGENKALYFHINYCCCMGFGDKHRAGMEDGNC